MNVYFVFKMFEFDIFFNKNYSNTSLYTVIYVYREGGLATLTDGVEHQDGVKIHLPAFYNVMTLAFKIRKENVEMLFKSLFYHKVFC